MTMFIGRPNISRCKNRPSTFETMARARIAKRSSASKPRKVTRVLRFRCTGVTSRAICEPPALSASFGNVLDPYPLGHSARAVGNKVFGLAQEARKQQAQPCRKKVPLPVAGVVNAHVRR